MTEALSQNLETNLDIAFDMLSTAAMPTFEVEGALEGEFSNLINTINANIEEAQTNFVDLAVKSNVSSINKFVLNENSTNNDEIMLQVENVVEPEAELEVKVENNIEPKVEVKDTNLNLQTTETKEENQVAETSTIPFDNYELKTTDKVEVKEVEAKIALNVSSDIETKTDVVEDKKEVELPKNEVKQEPIENIIISCFDILNQTQELEQLKTSFENDFSNIESIDELNKLDLSVDNIVVHLEETDLPADTKSQIKEAFSKIKNAIKEAKAKVETLTNEQSEVIDEAKKVLDEIVVKVVENNNKKAESKAIQPKEVESIVKNASLITEQKTNEVEVPVNNFDNVETEAKTDEIKPIENNNKIEPNEVETLELQPKNKVETKEPIKLEKLSEEIKPILDNLDSSNEKDTQAVLKLLNEFKDSSELNQDEKLQVENIIKQISSALKTKEVISSVLKDELKTDDKELETLEIKVDKQEVDFVSKTAQTKETAKNNNSSKKIDKSIESTIFEAKLNKIPKFSGALSVKDEVAKIAMSEETSTILNTVDTPIQSHVVYDNGIVKNNAFQNIQLKEVQLPKFDLENHDILNQISDKFTELKDAQGHKLTLVLRPNDLGRVSIELKSDKNGLTTNIIAQNSEVRSYIEKNIHNLRQSLVDSGINVNNIQIKTAGESQSSTYEGNQGQEHEQNQNQQEQRQNNSQNNQNKKDRQETLEAFSNFENQFKKDFSSVLNKTISYNLN